MRVTQRLQHAYRSKTWTMHKNMFLLFLAFCEFIQISAHPVSLQVLLFFVELLAFNNLKPTSIMNYGTVVKAQCKWFNLKVHNFDHPNFKLFMKAVNTSIRSHLVHKVIFDIQTLENIINVADSLPFSSVFNLFIFWPFLASCQFPFWLLIQRLPLT